MLSPRKNIRNSPSKENVSPVRKNDEGKAEKTLPKEVLMSAIQELQSIILKSGGQVPEHLNFGFIVTPNTKLQLIRADSLKSNTSDSQVKKLKIKVNDAEFELRKIEEDFAEYKIVSKMDREKEVKKLKEEINRLEKQYADENGKWEQKFQEMKIYYANQSKKEQDITKKESKELIERSLAAKTEQIAKIKKDYEQILLNLKQKHEIQQFQLEKQIEVKMKVKEEKVEEEREIIKKKHIEVVRKLEQKQEQYTLAFQSQKKIEEKKNEDEKIKFNKLKEKLYTDLYLVRKEKDQLSQQIQNYKNQIYCLKKSLQLKQLEVQDLADKYDEKLQAISEENSKKYQSVRNEYQSKYRNVYEESYRKMEKMRETIDKMNDMKNQKQRLLKEAQAELEKRFYERPARPEDTEKIHKQKYEILIRDQQLNTLQDELKRAKLEKDNNEKNYTRIFSAGGNKNRVNLKNGGTLEKDNHRDRIYKQANTVDMSFLLKVCQKQF